jgi:hypothetical protein
MSVHLAAYTIFEFIFRWIFEFDVSIKSGVRDLILVFVGLI